MSTVAEIPVGHWPTGLAVTPSGAKAYVANYNDNSVSVIDTHTRQVTATIPVGIRPAAMGHFIQPYGNTWPDAFSFSPVAGVQPSSPTAKAPNWVVSNSVTIQGIDEPVEALISCPGRCALSVDGGAWTEYAPNVAPGQSIRVRLAASTGYFTKTSTTLHVGASESTFSVTTKMKVILPILP
jgi:YVTN family beta-propeller protein